MEVQQKGITHNTYNKKQPSFIEWINFYFLLIFEFYYKLIILFFNFNILL